MGIGSPRFGLTFGSFKTLGVLNVARTDALEVVVVKALGSVLLICLDDTGKAQRTPDLAVRGRSPTRREAMLNDQLRTCGNTEEEDITSEEEELHSMLPSHK